MAEDGTDHPRSRGVYTSPLRVQATTSGSSPLARGLQQVQPPRGRWGRIIPARAGFTYSCWRRRMRQRDHPRSRGVYPAAASKSVPVSGSSPLARGLRRVKAEERRVRGIIPARAGFTYRPGARSAGRPDHPRSRGVYQGNKLVGEPHRGSSPLARGLPRPQRATIRLCRIIPARAGFTDMRLSVSLRSPDHPRSRGVYHFGLSRPTEALGSSPLARGLHPLDPPSPREYRIIPARAGFTTAGMTSSVLAWDHPRSRGVYHSTFFGTTFHYGSSPLARGLRAGSRHAPWPAGIIPARAGFTPRRGGWCGAAADHPRSRGVYYAFTNSYHQAQGSSPLARGLQSTLSSCDPRLRIIPARAGFT